MPSTPIRGPMFTSPSARRAWIEIHLGREMIRPALGRPPRGGRGLKSFDAKTSWIRDLSPSARRAWIEMESRKAQRETREVALREEGVD